MRNVLLPVFIAVFAVLSISCTKENPVELTSEQETALVGFLAQVQDMSATEDGSLNITLSSFYQAQNADICTVDNFDFITNQDLIDYTQALGYSSVRDLHDWMVDFGLELRGVIPDAYIDQPEMEKLFQQLYPELLEDAGFGDFDESRSLGNNKCSVNALSAFSYYAVIKANNYGIRSSTGTRIATDIELVDWGSSLHRSFDLINELNSCE